MTVEDAECQTVIATIDKQINNQTNKLSVYHQYVTSIHTNNTHVTSDIVRQVCRDNYTTNDDDRFVVMKMFDDNCG